MKKIILGILMTVGFLANAQEYKLEEKSVTVIFEANSKTKAELFSAINKWISVNYKSAKKLNIKLDSLKMRIQNFAYLYTNKGLRKYSKQTESVYLSKKNLNKVELKAEYELAIS